MSDEFIAYGGFLGGVALLAFGVFVAPRIVAWYLGRFVLPGAQKVIHGYQKWATPPTDMDGPADVSATRLRVSDHPIDGQEIELAHVEARKR